MFTSQCDALRRDEDAERRGRAFPRRAWELAKMSCGVVFSVLIVWLAGTVIAPAFADDNLPLRQGLVIPSVGTYGRSAVHTDALEAVIVAGKWTAPNAGDEVRLPDGSARQWEPITAAADGSITHRALGGGYVYFAVPSDAERVMILEAAGHSTVYVNGEPRTGDPYSHGYVHLPVRLRRGTNDFLFHVGRGRLSAKLVSPKAAAFIELADMTLPDLLLVPPNETWAGIIVTNASTEPLDGAAIAARFVANADGGESQTTSLPSISPLSTRKVAVRLVAPVTRSEGDAELELILHGPRNNGAAADAKPFDTANVKLRVLRPDQTHKRTFRSSIDDSVQYFALVPSKNGETRVASGAPAKQRPALVMTLHGAGVEAIGQAACFSSKPDLITVAPTNRRPYGFDWEDWGRLDAMEVLELVERELGTDPRRTYLTGHSMGGHGAWHVGVTYPSRFAAIGPSAGWISMSSYAGARRPENPNQMQALLLRAAASSDTLALVRNYSQHGVFVLHGDQDDNVPVGQARTMRQRLAEFHPDFVYREQPGAGHWWGNACVDWPPMVDFFLQHTLSERQDVQHVEFTTVNPGVSAWSHWIGIDAQQRQFLPSVVNVSFDAKARRFSGKTENVARIVLDLGHLEPAQPLQVELDGEKLADIAWPEPKAPNAPPQVWLERRADNWQLVQRPAAASKGAHRYGPFKDAFRNHMQFVHGTQGTAEENAWSLAKARLDAERFWYQGNGSVDVVADQQFRESTEGEKVSDRERDRNVILYGNADTNSAWSALLSASPVQVRRGSIRIGQREIAGEDLACLFVRPRPESDQALVGVVSGSGLAGLRLTDRMPYFVSGTGYPDCLVLGAEMLAKGADGIRAAGFFGLDWGVDAGEFVWHE